MEALETHEQLGAPGDADRRAELALTGVVCAVLAIVAAMLVFVFREAWPSFAHNGLHWFGAGGGVDTQIQAIFTSGDLRAQPVYTVHAWPLIWGTPPITRGPRGLAFLCSLFLALFI